MAWLARLWRWLIPPPPPMVLWFNVSLDPEDYWRWRLHEADKQLRLAANAFAVVVIGALREESLD